jgi:hypothetical protein
MAENHQVKTLVDRQGQDISTRKQRVQISYAIAHERSILLNRLYC